MLKDNVRSVGAPIVNVLSTGGGSPLGELRQPFHVLKPLDCDRNGLKMMLTYSIDNADASLFSALYAPYCGFLRQCR